MKRYLAFLLVTCLAGAALAGGLKVASPGFSAAVAQTITAIWDFTGKVHLGGAWASGEADVEAEKLLRVTGCTGGATSGTGIEICGQLSGENFITVYNRTGGAYAILYVDAAPLKLNTASAAYVQIGGQTQVIGYASATMRTTAPQAAGFMAYNTNAFTLCIASGTGAGAWVAVNDGTTACD